MSWPAFWQKRTLVSRLLQPLAALVCNVAQRRHRRWQASFMPPLPTAAVVVVGNVAAGGVGKTPFIEWLGRLLAQHDIPYGIVSRGYGGRAPAYPLETLPETDPRHAGDEPVMLAQSLQAPVMVDPRRDRAVAALLARHPRLRVILSDDGLQHYALTRDFEIVLIDGARGMGNGLCLPAGPLREPARRLLDADWLVTQGMSMERAWPMGRQPDACMRLEPEAFCHVRSGRRVSLAAFSDQPVCALAGIGSPQRFFDTLAQLNIRPTAVFPLPDHASPRQLARALAQCDGRPVLMTHKDAVKCRKLSACDHAWYLQTRPALPEAFAYEIVTAIQQRLKDKYES